MTKESAQRFDLNSDQYMNSLIHQNCFSIQTLKKAVTFKEKPVVADVGSGPGHCSFALAEPGASFTGIDPSTKMLENYRTRLEPIVKDIQTVTAFAESIPLPEGTFDLVISRLAAHHFHAPREALFEMTRIAKKGGYIVIVDLVGFENPDHDHFNHQLELLHDPTHVRSYPIKKWETWFREAGLTVKFIAPRVKEAPVGLPLKAWCTIAQTPLENQYQIRKMLTQKDKGWLEELGIQYKDNDFSVPVIVGIIVGEK